MTLTEKQLQEIERTSDNATERALIAEVRRLRSICDDVRATLRHHATDELKVSMLNALLDEPESSEDAS